MILYKIGGFDCKKSSKFEENSKINIYSFVPVPQIDHPVALCIGLSNFPGESDPSALLKRNL